MHKKTIDGNTAAAYIAYAFSEVTAIYPITPSSTMGELIEMWAKEKKIKNCFGQIVDVIQMQSEAGAAATVHGILSAGAFSSTFTASQGLLLMIPEMYKIAGELLPTVFHVSARALASQALSIFGDHQDVMATRQTGFCQIVSNSIQEVLDFALIAHLSSLESSLPFLHFFDGFRTSHEIQKIEAFEYDEIKNLINFKSVENFRKKALNPNHPHVQGTAQNPDIYFQVLEKSNLYYERVIDIVQNKMDKIFELTNRRYNLFDYVGDENAKNVLVMMGSGCETAEETILHLNSQGEKFGLIKVRLYRPFSQKHFLQSLPKNVEKIVVLDRTKESGSVGCPLYLDVLATCSKFFKPFPKIIGGRYGLGGKEFTPSMVLACFENLIRENSLDNFSVGIDDDISFQSIKVNKNISTQTKDVFAAKFYGLGGDGTVSANKEAIKIIGDNTNKYVQANFSYDSKKTSGLTISDLRFANHPIKSAYFIEKADFIACHHPSFIEKYDLLANIKKNGIFLLNSHWTFLEKIEKFLPNKLKKEISIKNVKFLNIDAFSIANEIGLGKHINLIMQTCFFKLCNLLNFEQAIKLLKDAVVNAYGKKGEKIVEKNIQAIDLAIKNLKEIKYPESWKDLKEKNSLNEENLKKPEFIKNVCDPINKLQGDKLKVSSFQDGGKFPLSTSKYEKRKISENVPVWDSKKCIQCNQCAFICPHAAIRPYLLTEETVKNSPCKIKTAKPLERKVANKFYTIAISPDDCTGCGKCIEFCKTPNGKALLMKNIEECKDDEKIWDYLAEIESEKSTLNKFSIKGSQFEKPLLEFSGACAGCTQPVYVKLLTQLFGEKMIIANATGCSSIWGASAPCIPWTTSKNGKGPAWANSLFEDNAEFGLGIFLAYKHRRQKLKSLIEKSLLENISKDLNEKFKLWLENFDDENLAKIALQELEKNHNEKITKEIFSKNDLFVKPSIWIIGGDGWAYDIGFGGLDHVLAMNQNVNILVLDTEVYSNTGGQSSKATPTGAIAKFAALGKTTRKKDLAAIAINYKDVYVASISIEADPKQALRVFKEAESFSGPSLIIAYSSCINHGIKGGMANAITEANNALKSAYWINFRYDPRKDKPFTLDSKPDGLSVKEFVKNQNRFLRLIKTFPEIAEELLNTLERDVIERFEKYSNFNT